MTSRPPAAEPGDPRPPAAPADGALCLWLLGGFRAEVGGRAISPSAWRLRKARHLVALLALAPGRRLPREQIMDALWPDPDPDAAANNLRVALHAARRALAPAAILAQAETLILSPEASAWTDVAAFEAAITDARKTREPADGWAAVDLYAGDLLPEDAYEDWAAGPREALHAAHLGVLGELAAWEEDRGQRARAITALEQFVALEPAAEAAHRTLMRLHAETGQRPLALRQYERLRAALRDALDAEPDPASRALHLSIATGALTPAPAPTGVLRSAPEVAAAGAEPAEARLLPGASMPASSRAGEPPPAEQAAAVRRVAAAATSAGPDPLAGAPPALVGRAREQALLAEVLAAALAGRGGLALVSGEAGIGKTALAESLLAEARARGALALVGRCYDLGETPPYSPWADLFARLPAGPDPPGAPAPFAGGDGPASRAALFERAREALAAAAARRPLALLLDDAHWADPASLELLRHLARRLGDLPVLLLATYRAEEVARGHPLYRLLPALAREAPAVRLALRPLDLPAVAALVDARYPLTGADRDRLVASLDRRAEGNPFFVGELLRALEEAGLLAPPGVGGGPWALGDLERAPLPSLVRQVIDARVDHLGEAARELLAAAAVIGQQVTSGLWAAVAGVEEAALLPALDAALGARLLEPGADPEGVRFAHALVREALYEGAPPARRRAWHRRAAEALAAAPAPDPDAVAYHFRRAGDERAVGWLVQAGDRARASWAWRTAAARYEAALALAGGRDALLPDRGWTLLKLAQMRAYADARRSLPAADEALRLAGAADDRGLRAAGLHWRGFLAFAAGDLRRGMADLEACVAAAAALSPTERARAQAFLAPLAMSADRSRTFLALLLAWVGRYAEARAIAEPLVDRPLSPSGRPSMDAYAALIDVYAALGDPAGARRLSAEGRDLAGVADQPFVAGYWPLRDLLMIALPYAADDLVERRRLAAEGAVAFARADDMVSPHAARAARLPLLTLEGRWAEAREVGRALRAAPEAGEAWWVRVAPPLLAGVALARGEAAEAAELVREALPAGAATEPGGTYLHAGLALQRVAAVAALAAGDPAAARAWLEAHDRWLAWSGATLGRAEGQAAWAAWHRAAGDRTRARAHAERALAHAAAPRQPLALLAARRLLGELATEAGRRADAARHLDAALALAEACAAPHERALTLLALAELRAASGRRAEARALLDEARAICGPLEARPALARAEALAAELSDESRAMPPAAPWAAAGLSARQAEVLRLVAAGLSNAEVAERLALSPRTVDTHLRAIYARLGVASRTAAARVALDRGLA